MSATEGRQPTCLRDEGTVGDVVLGEDWLARRSHLGVRNPALVLSELLRLVFDLDEPLAVSGCTRSAPVRAVVDEALEIIYSAPTVAHSWEPAVAIATIGATCEVLLAGRELLRGEAALSGHMPGLEHLVDHVVQGRMWHVDRHGRVLAPMGGSPQTPWPVRVRPLNLGAESELALDAAAGLRMMTYGLQGLAAEIALYGPGEDSMGALRGVRRTVGGVLDRVHKDIRQIGPRHHDIGSRARAKCFAMIGALDWLMNCVEIEIDEDLARAVDQARLSASRLADFPTVFLRETPCVAPAESSRRTVDDSCTGGAARQGDRRDLVR